MHYIGLLTRDWGKTKSRANEKAARFGGFATFVLLGDFRTDGYTLCDPLSLQTVSPASEIKKPLGAAVIS
jgi:hypothetical protein